MYGVGAALNKEGVGAVCFTDLSKNYNIGDKVQENEKKQETILTLAFEKVESIDVVIKALEKAKQLIKETQAKGVN